jgi:hypothetical protein
LISIWTPTTSGVILNSTSTQILTIYEKKSIISSQPFTNQSYHGFGEHTLVTTTVGHVIAIHPQVGHGARVAIVVVVVVVITSR